MLDKPSKYLGIDSLEIVVTLVWRSQSISIQEHI